ncbi:MAG: CCA tRNA nucleotidyltransferase [Gemmatimonadales bacterium]
MNPPTRLDLPSEVVEIATTLEAAGFETWCVGGAIRDALLGHPREDVDLATRATPEEIQRLFKKTVPVGIKFGTVGVLDRHRQLHEVTTFRHDVVTDGRHAVVQYGASLEEDLARRDFTMNAVAYHPTRHEWRDPFGGAADLARGTIRAVGVPGERFREDYLRILRAIRFAARLGFSIDAATWVAAVEAASGLGRLSAERVRDEWFRALESARSVARLVSLWHEVGAAREWLPGLHLVYPLADAAPAPRDPVLLTAALMADPGAALRRLKASTAEIDRVTRIARGPADPAGTDGVSVRRWLAAVGPAADDLLTSYRWQRGVVAPWANLVAETRRLGHPVARGGLAVTGDDLAAAGIGSGPRQGRILAGLLEAVLEDPTRNERDELLRLARSIE